MMVRQRPETIANHVPEWGLITHVLVVRLPLYNPRAAIHVLNIKSTLAVRRAII